MDDCIQALERTYAEAAEGNAVNARRSDMLTPTSRPDGLYCLKLTGAVVPRLKVGALRLNSDILTFPSAGGKTRKVKIPAAPGNRWVGLVLLFCTDTGTPLAIFPDGVVQRMRVGGTSGLAVKYLARHDARIATIIGSGWQAGAQAMAVAATRDLEEIRCFSPNPASREAFASEMQSLLGISARAMDSAESAVKGSDIVLCATNSLQPVFNREWIEDGMHIGSIRDREIDPEAIARADRIVVHNPENMGSEHIVLASGVTYQEGAKEFNTHPSLLRFADSPSLADLVGGKSEPRCSDKEVTCFLNYHGVGLQFAAAGAVLYEKARAAGLGRELPTEWFTETVHP